MAEGMNGFAATLVPVKGEALERGDYVYETVRYGQGPEHVKYHKYRVMEVERDAVRVADPDGKERPKKIRMNQLRIEKPAGSAVSERISTPNVSSRALEPQDEQYAAWLDMGRTLVEDIAAEARSLAEQKTKVLKDLEGIDSGHKRHIESLEGQLEVARREHAEDRALASTRVDAVNAKIDHVNNRKAALESMLGGSK